MSSGSMASTQVVTLPKGGGALQGIGEKFSPDLHTGTGNFTVPISLPHGRNGFQPQLNLVYSTGNGNGPFGLGWNLSVPSISRKTSLGIPRYDDTKDVFVLSGAEDLVPVETLGTTTRYRPRTEGLFAKILHHRNPSGNEWEIRSKDGLVSYYGSGTSLGSDSATIANPSNPQNIFSWKLTRTEDSFGNRIEYEYERDKAELSPHNWDQLYLARIRYIDFGDGPTNRNFLVSVSFHYEQRPDPHSEYRSGFEIRTRKRCTGIVIDIDSGASQRVRSYELVYLDQRPEVKTQLHLNGVSLLSQIKVSGHDGDELEARPPLEFGYTRFDPTQREFIPLQGANLPATSLANPDLELVDLFGNGLPDLVELNNSMRYWRNLGRGRFDTPRFMKNAPVGLALQDSGVQFIDADGDGRTDLLVTTSSTSGYFSLQMNGEWDRRSFQRYRQAPSFDLEDPEVKLVDLDGDGVTDAIRSGSRFECFFNDPKEGWSKTRWVERKAVDAFPNVNFADPRVKWADLTGDGLQNIILVHDGSIEYWPNLGYGEWGKRIRMENSPRFPYGYDPRRILIGDVDGDGLADIVYVENGTLTLWINQSGNRWSDPITVLGTPSVSDIDAVRLVDVLGSGVSGVLFSKDANGLSRDHLFFHDFTGGRKPYLLDKMDNHIGAVTKVEYTPSTRFYVKDQQRPDSRWNTPLPFPVQVVCRVAVTDFFSQSTLTTEYRYHYGHWDGAEREFRGFGMVEQFDTEIFESDGTSALQGAENQVDRQFVSPPTLTKTWFHLGPVGDEFGDFREVDWSSQYWQGDSQILKHTEAVNHFLQRWPQSPRGRRIKRDALRALRGSILRTELYALDGSDREDRPYSVSEFSYGLMEIDPPLDNGTARLHNFFPHIRSTRTTQWERGDDPLTHFSFVDDYDQFGQPRKQTQIACPRGWKSPEVPPGQPYLGTRTLTVYAQPATTDIYISDRIAKVTTYEIQNSGDTLLLDLNNIPDDSSSLKLIGQTLNFYDGNAFQGLPFGKLESHGALVRTETLTLTAEILHNAYKSDSSIQNPPEEPPCLSSGSSSWTSEYPQQFRDLLSGDGPSDPTRPGLTITPAGYGFSGGSGEYARGYFVATERRQYDFQFENGRGRGLVFATRNPLGHETSITYDSRLELLPVTVRDAAGMETRVAYDYRVLQPAEINDPNDNFTRFRFTPLGLLKEIRNIGNPEKVEGDRLKPSVTFEYSFLAFMNSPPDSRQPIFVRTKRRVHHDTETDVSLPGLDQTIETVEYSDGCGRLLQTRTQGEEVRFGDEHFGGGESLLPGQLSGTAGGDLIGKVNTDLEKPYVVVNGWQIYDNKGRVVEKYEPFFSEGWDYARPRDRQLGQRLRMHYNPRGQVLRTVNPDGSEQRVVYGVPFDLADPDVFAPTVWETYTYDANDNAGRTHATSSVRYRHYWNTPASATIDALGRTVLTIERNRAATVTSNEPLSPIEEYRTSYTYDILGSLLVVNDTLRRDAFKYIYDLANRPLRTESIDAGLRRTVLDAAGNEIERRDSKGALVLQAHDVLSRPIRLWARDGAQQPLTLREYLIYGDSTDTPPAEAKTRNLLGKLFKHYDEAGLLTFDAYDFKGNVLEKARQVLSDERILSVFASAPSHNWKVQAFRVDWQPKDDGPLEGEARALLDGTRYRTSFTYDALNRVNTMRYPQDVEGNRKLLRPRYNRAGALEKVALDGDTFVERIAYNAKGQRVFIAYGNNVMTRYAYDPRTFRLLRLRTEKFVAPSEVTYRLGGAPLQDLAYEFDLVGNILKIRDRTPGCGVINSSAGQDALDRDFSHDALYRLLAATGRESSNILSPRPWTDDRRNGYNSGKHGTPNQDNAPQLTRLYREEYRYDPVGNLLTLKHIDTQSGAAWGRHFGIGGLTPQQWDSEWQTHFNSSAAWTNPPGNRLTHVGDNQTVFPQTHVYDANGSMTRETTSRHFEWDYADRLKVFQAQVRDAEPSVHTHYLYDADGQRAKKLVRHQGGHVEVTVYIECVFEHIYVTQGENQTHNVLHVSDNQKRIGLARIGNPFPDDNTPAVKYYVGDHLGSSMLVIDGVGLWINREEYTPYGDTSFGSFALKRYRFTGNERDGESGLNYHNARYLAPWAGRWISCDPVGPLEGMTLYAYALDNPVAFTDSGGMEADELEKSVANAAVIRDEVVNGVRVLEFNGLEVLEESTPQEDDAITLGQSELPISVNGQRGDPDISAGGARSDEKVNGFKDGAKRWTLFDDLMTLGAILGFEWDPDKVAPGSESGGIPQGQASGKPNPLAQVIYSSIQLVSLIGPGKVLSAGRKGATRSLSLLRALSTKPPAPRTYITYVFKNARGIRYVGRAQGKGTPEEVLMGRLRKNHKVWERYAEAEDLGAEVLAVHSNRQASMGGESVYHDYFTKNGHSLLNDPQSPPLSVDPRKLEKTRARIEAFFQDW